MMQQLELLSIENPCIGVCQTDNRGYCKGCFRSRDERFDWAGLTPPQKRKVLELCKGRGKRRIAKQKAEQEALQKSQQKSPNDQTQIAITTVTDDSTTKEPHQDEQQQLKQSPQQSPQQDQSCVSDCDQSVQDMGLDLFDL